MLALCLICLPVSALGESYSAASLTLSNPSLTYGGETLSFDMGLNLDVGYDVENAAGRILASLFAGNETALSGGISWTSTEAVAALDGMSQGIKLPLEELLEELMAELNDTIDDMGLNNFSNPELESALESFLDYFTSGDVAYNAGVKLGEHIHMDLSPDYTFQHGDLVTLTGDATLFSISMSDLVDCVNEIRAEDAQLAQYLDELSAAFLSLLGVDELDWSVLGELPLSIGGFYLNTQNGDYAVSLSFDLATDDTETVHLGAQLAVLNDEDNTRAFFFLNTSSDDEAIDLSLDVKIPYAEGSTKIALSISVSDDDENDTITLIFENGTASQTTLSMNVVNGTLYDGEWYIDEVDIALIYTAQDAVSSGESITYPGHLCCQLSYGGITGAMDLDTSLRLYTTSEGYTAPAAIVDIATADEDTLTALLNEASSVASQGIARLLQAAGIDTMLGM